jgi:glyoxylase-like metal-dependent hydrolase (beta-lactamase superfamily II)
MASPGDSADNEGVAAAYEVYAVRYATLPAYPVRSLVAGADPARRLDIAMMVWAIRGDSGRVVLFDAGFYRDRFMTRWRPTDYVRPSEALAEVGIRPEQVTDVVISHVHWDHLDGADLFPSARVWLQRSEYEHHVGAGGEVLNPTIDAEDAAMLARLRSAGRVSLVDGESVEIIPGITVFTGGKHTYASQYLSVRTDAGVVVLASDNAYLYENLELRAPIAQTLDRQSNLTALERMLSLASHPRLVVPGHDPAVFERFGTRGSRVARIR